MSESPELPNPFELPGLASAKRALRGLLFGETGVHAVLFYGEEGAGKATFAKALSRSWLCRQPSPEGACGECRPCLTFAKRNNPDWLEVFPRGVSHSIRLAAVHDVTPMPEEYVDVIRIHDHLRTLPLSSRHKVVTIFQADRMTGDTSRALLKSIEEPPAHAKFVLTATEIGRVEATIRSRCLTVPCELPTVEEFRAAYPDLLDWELVLARRAPGLLRRMREHPSIFEDIFLLAQRTAKGKPEAALGLSEQMRKLVERLAKAEEGPTRHSGAVALKAFGTALAHFGVSAAPRIAESHRRILGNVQAGLEFDALFVWLLAENRKNLAASTGVLA